MRFSRTCASRPSDGATGLSATGGGGGDAIDGRIVAGSGADAASTRNGAGVARFCGSGGNGLPLIKTLPERFTWTLLEFALLN